MDPLFAQGLTLALFGMGTVFFFLTVLVLVTMLLSVLIMRYGPQAPIPAEPAPEDARRRAAIAAAIHRYRTSRSGGGQ